MHKYYILLFFSGLLIDKLTGQSQICDTLNYFIYELKAHTPISTLDCDVFFINSKTKDRFLLLQEEYPKAIHEGLQLDSIYNGLLQSLEFNIKRLDSISIYQNNQIEVLKKNSMPKVESSIISIISANDNIRHANLSIEKAIIQIHKSNSKKWVYMGIGFLAGGLTIALIK